MPDPKSPSVGIVTVSYNSSTVLGPFLSSARSVGGAEIPIVVADNGSDDLVESRRLCREFDAILLELGHNFGYGGAVNRGIDALGQVDAVLISNPDVVLQPGALAALTATLDSYPDAGAVGPAVHNTDGSVYPSARRLPSLRTGIGHALFSRVWRTNPWTAAYLSDTAKSTTVTRAGWLSGSCLLVRKTAFDAIHGFDEEFFMYFEDVDLGYRMGKSGWASYFQPAASVMHTGAHSTSNESSRMVAAHHRSATLYLHRKYAAWYLAPIRLAVSISLAARSWWLRRPRTLH